MPRLNKKRRVFIDGNQATLATNICGIAVLRNQDGTKQWCRVCGQFKEKFNDEELKCLDCVHQANRYIDNLIEHEAVLRMKEKAMNAFWKENHMDRVLMQKMKEVSIGHILCYYEVIGGRTEMDREALTDQKRIRRDKCICEGHSFRDDFYKQIYERDFWVISFCK